MVTAPLQPLPTSVEHFGEVRLEALAASHCAVVVLHWKAQRSEHRACFSLFK